MQRTAFAMQIIFDPLPSVSATELNEHNRDSIGERLDACDRAAHDIERRRPMTGRDRIVIVVFGALAVVAAAWLLVVAPEREKASKLGSEVSAAQAQLTTAESQVASARAAQAGYPTAYASLVSLGKAVPTGQEVPSLIYQLAHASNQKQVDFTSITTGGSAGGSGGSSSATPAAATAGFTQMPFTFVFNGSFFDLYNLFQQLNQLHPAHHLRQPEGQRSPAHDPERPVGPGIDLGLWKELESTADGHDHRHRVRAPRRARV